MGIYDNYIHKIKNNDVNDIKDTLLNAIKSENIYANVPDKKEDFSKNHMSFYKTLLLNQPMKQNKKQTEINIIQHFVENPFRRLD